jgi:hypothetical protein
MWGGTLVVALAGYAPACPHPKKCVRERGGTSPGRCKHPLSYWERPFPKESTLIKLLICIIASHEHSWTAYAQGVDKDYYTTQPIRSE